MAGQLQSTQSKGIRMPKVFEAKTIRNPKGLQFTVGSPWGWGCLRGIFKTAGLQDVESGVCEGNSDLKAHRSSDTKPIAGGIAQRT